MGIYKKYKGILQGLLFNLSVSGLLCLVFFSIIPYALGAGSHDSKSGERKIAAKGVQKEIEMSDKDELSREEGEYLLKLARATIEEKLFDKDVIEEEPDLPEKYLDKRAAFVTLNKNGNLRGCIGHIVPQVSLVESIQSNALSAAFRDPRFPPLSREEWNDIEVEISILTVPEQLRYAGAEDLLEKLRPGIDGVILIKDNRQSTFLPQVWDQLPDKTEFLSHLCMKAGMDANEWKKGDITVFTYQAQAFEEH